MEAKPSRRMRTSELEEELLLVENTILYTQIKLRYFPDDYGRDLASLMKRRARIVAKREEHPVD